MFLSLHASAYYTHSSAAVRTYLYLSDSQNHSDAIWQVIYGYEDQLDCLFAEGGGVVSFLAPKKWHTVVRKFC